jgi:hypothetical protein
MVESTRQTVAKEHGDTYTNPLKACYPTRISPSPCHLLLLSAEGVAVSVRKRSQLKYATLYPMSRTLYK